MALYTAYTDGQLLPLLNIGDENAFREIYSRYREPLSIYAYRITGVEEEALDVVQEIFVSLWRRRIDIAVHTSLKSYLYKSAANGCARYIQRNIRERDFLSELSEVFLQQEAPIASGHLEETEVRKKMEDIVSGMPEKMQAVFRLSREEQLSHREIGDRLGISETTVKKHVQNALKIIRQELGGTSITLLVLLSHFL